MNRVFIEGLPGAGKTTTTKFLRESGLPVAQDFGLVHGADDYPGNGTTIDAILAIDDWFIDKESERMKSDADIFDRSYLGNLTYAYAYGRHMRLDSFKPTVIKYEQALALGKLALPEGLVYIDVDPEISIERQYKRVDEGVPLLDDFWRDKSFLQDLRDAHHALFEACINITTLVIDGEIASPIIANRVASFYSSLNKITAPPEPQLQFNQYIASLEIPHDI